MLRNKKKKMQFFRILFLMFVNAAHGLQSILRFNTIYKTLNYTGSYTPKFNTQGLRF